MNSIIPWPGGKRRLAKHLLPLFPNHKTYVEAFAGGAGLLFARPAPAPVEVLNDLNGDLVNLYRVVQHHLDELVRQFRWALVSRTMFDWSKMQRPETLTDVQRAARFYYLQKTAFGAKVTGQTFGTAASAPPKLNLLRMEEDLSLAHLRLARVTVERLAWQDCLDRYDRPDTLFFLDPPYWKLAGYGVDFPFTEYEAMAEKLASLKGKAILTINDHPDIRRVFQGFRSKRVQISYTVGGNGRSPKQGELIYRSWDGTRDQE